jgi:hypothetical protein
MESTVSRPPAPEEDVRVAFHSSQFERRTLFRVLAIVAALAILAAGNRSNRPVRRLKGRLPQKQCDRSPDGGLCL